MTHADIGYEIKSRRGFVPHVIAECVGCGMKLEFPVGSRNPEHIAKHIRSKLWSFALGKRGRTRCPECEAERAEKAKGESGKKVVEMFGQTVMLPAKLAPADAQKIARYHVTFDSVLTLEEVEHRLKSMGATVHKLEAKQPRKPGTGLYERTEFHRQRLRDGMRRARLEREKSPQPLAQRHFA